MKNRIVLDVDRDGWTQNLQLNLLTLDENDSGMGFRLAGPKYNGSSKNLLRTELDERDATEIRKALDVAFPLPAVPSRAEVLHQAARLMEAAGYDDDAVNWLDTYADYNPAGSADSPTIEQSKSTGIDYGVRLTPDAPDNEVLDYRGVPRTSAEDRLRENRVRHPDAQLVERTVHHSAWTDAATT
ncbi:hypothetical protein ACIOEZ_34045 [Streptomyces sp. NPDC087866]|uniref:hypothetical protein n=1 Tax=Streptomyces sp. NPDC087866 TaxID=3365815 RepID=UPI00381748A9